MEMSKVFKFDKVAYTSLRRVNSPEVEMRLYYKDGDMKKPALSVCGNIWNATHTDTVMCGQCLDEMLELDGLSCDDLFRKLHRLWKLYHLNDMRSGTIKQENALNDARKQGKLLCYYEDSRKYLESIGLLEDDGYKYGSSWLYREIPEIDLKEIVSLLSEQQLQICKVNSDN